MNERIKALMGKTLDEKFSHTWDTMTYEGLLQFSEKFADLIRADEREACAKVCDDLADVHEKANQWGSHKTADALAQSIRARGNT